MLSAEDNKLLTEVGHGTPMGGLMRRYWHPIAATAELDDHPTKPVRVLGEDLVLYRDRSGTLGLIDRLCAHRRVDLSYGIPEEHGLRCMYHGWLYDETGQCIAQPFEETVHSDGRFKEKVRMKGYPVRDFAGLLWAYLGPEPAPLIPMWEPFTWDDCFHDIAIAELPCNWLQCQENAHDPVHLEWLHGYWTARQQVSQASSGSTSENAAIVIPRAHKKIGFTQFQSGIIKRRVVEGTAESDTDWTVGHPALFPNMLLVGDQVKGNLQWRVPRDDTHTLHISWYFFKAAPGHRVPRQQSIPHYYVPLDNDDGTPVTDLVNNQDFFVWITQGPVARRDREHLGESDRGIILLRKQLMGQLAILATGEDPMNVFRDLASNRSIQLPLEPWPVLQDTQYATSYIPDQAGESMERVRTINRVLATWADASAS